jgi:uncharacterized membrane protein YfcA
LLSVARADRSDGTPLTIETTVEYPWLVAWKGKLLELSVSGMEINPLVLPLVAFVISVFTSLGGISGAFLILPFQVSVLGFTSPAVSATNHVYNIVATPGGVWRYVREGRMVWPLAWIVVIGTLPGVFIGAIIRIRYLPDPRDFKLFVGIVLCYIGVRLSRDLLDRSRSPSNRSAETRFEHLARTYRRRVESGEELPRIHTEELSVRRLVYGFYGERFEVPVIPIFAISVSVGVLGGAYGIGGGAIMAPLCVALFGLPVYTVAGATLMATLITSVAGVAFYHSLAPFYLGVDVSPDWTLGLLFGIGGFAGTYCGARLQKFIPARAIKIILAGCLFFLAGGYIVSYFLRTG